MTRRYMTRPQGWLDLPDSLDARIDQGPSPLSITVHIRDSEPVKTGLLDHLGNALYACDDPDPIGFMRWGRK